ncbi:MAG: hypothetical protein R3321_00135 [Nitrososphaeraceae archaeon]|nr:hypothetical protein [Nitrososphaeraceae archaeon]
MNSQNNKLSTNAHLLFLPPFNKFLRRYYKAIIFFKQRNLTYNSNLECHHIIPRCFARELSDTAKSFNG